MSGYWNCPEETTQTIRSGWLVSGDMVVRGSEGYISVVDRKRDMIISGGYNVYSSEVESVLQRHPGVGEVAVVGVPDPYWGETVVAFICLLADRESTEAEVLSFAEQSLASYKRPRAVYFAQTLPKTTTGKIRKNELRVEALKLWQSRKAASSTNLQPMP
jgi:fatty-acyl-CoA synthase